MMLISVEPAVVLTNDAMYEDEILWLSNKSLAIWVTVLPLSFESLSSEVFMHPTKENDMMSVIQIDKNNLLNFFISSSNDFIIIFFNEK